MQVDRPNVIPWPPLIYAGFAALGLTLHWQLPLPWPEGFTVMEIPGFAIMALAILFELWATSHFYRQRTSILPHRAASSLITTGPFAWSRNPIYLGNTLLLVGFGMAFGVAWLIVLAPVAAVTTLQLAILREEAHLAQKFGPAWEVYAATTRRWLGRKS